MNVTIFAILLCFAVLLLVLPTKGCSCVVQKRSNPNFLCCFGYALRGKVISNVVEGNWSDPEPPNRVFTVKTQEIFKGEERLKTLNNGNTSYIKIYTAVYGASCGTDIPTNKDYIITGSFWKNETSNDACNSWNIEWKDVSQEVKDFTPNIKTCPCGVGCIMPLYSLLLLVVVSAINNAL